MGKGVFWCVMAYSHLVTSGIWLSLIYGFAYHMTTDEGDWTCYAKQDSGHTLPYDIEVRGKHVPDKYHDVNSNF